MPQSETELKEILAEAKYYLVEGLVSQCEALLAKKKEQQDPICRVPLITSTKEERLLVSTANKVSGLIINFVHLIHSQVAQAHFN